MGAVLTLARLAAMLPPETVMLALLVCVTVRGCAW